MVSKAGVGTSRQSAAPAWACGKGWSKYLAQHRLESTRTRLP